MTGLASDRRYCRLVLPRVSRTFAINIRLLPGPLRESVGTAYLLCRIADTLEDTWKGTPDEIGARFAAFRDAVDGDDRAAFRLAEGAAALPGDREDLALVARLPSVWRVYQALEPADREAIAGALHVMGAGMCRYSARAAARPEGSVYLDDEPELDDYCWVVAGCVGVMLTKLHARRTGTDAPTRARQLELAPVVGRALQLTNILLDWPHDVRRGRCYLPAAWLAEHGLAPADLAGRPHPGLDALARRLEQRARAALARVPDYLDLLPARSRRWRLFVLVPALWALRSIDRARRDPGFPWADRRPKLTRAELWSAGASALLGEGSVEELRRAENVLPATTHS